jgi:TonB-linked SusC/RagA family outer membrane protein
MNRYMATATIRRDGSSALAYDNRWDNFPSFSVAWDMKQEDFLADINPISQLKLRYGYGISGNQSVPAYSAFSTYEATRGNEGLITYTLSPGNQALRWEKTYQANYGLDLGFLNNRITVNVDYYDKKTDGAINRVILPDDTGQSSRLMNSAVIANKGIEGTIGIVPVSRNDFYWKTDISLAKNETIIEKLGDIDSDFMELGNSWGDTFFRYYEGHRIGTIFGLQADGVWTTEEINDPNIPKPTSPIVRPGSYKYIDQPNEDGEVDGVINADDYVIIGDGQPVFNWGMNNQFTYKNFDLSLFIIGFHGFDIYNYPRSFLSNTLSPFPELANRWIEGVNENASIAGFGPNRDARSNELIGSSTFVEKGDFIKVKNVTLGYTIPTELTSKINLSSIRAYLSIQNLHTFTKYSGNDPEMAVSSPLRPGLDVGTFPSTRQFMVGLSVMF